MGLNKKYFIIGVGTLSAVSLIGCTKLKRGSADSASLASSASGTGYLKAEDVQPPQPEYVEIPKPVEHENPATDRPTNSTDPYSGRTTM